MCPPSLHTFAAQRLASPRHEQREDAGRVIASNAQKLRQTGLSQAQGASGRSTSPNRTNGGSGGGRCPFAREEFAECARSAALKRDEVCLCDRTSPNGPTFLNSPQNGTHGRDRKEVQQLIDLGQSEGLPHLRRGQRRAARRRRLADQIDDVMGALGDEDIEIVDARHAGARSRRSASPTKRRRDEEGRRSRSEERGRGRRLLLEVQRPGAHVPAQDGRGLAAHARGRGRDRQAHRGGRAARCCRPSSNSLDRRRGDPRARRQAPEAQDPRQGRHPDADERRRRVRRGGGRPPHHPPHRQGQAPRQGDSRSSPRSSRPSADDAQEGASKPRSTTNREQELVETLEEMRLNKKTDRQDRPQAQGAHPEGRARREPARPSSRSARGVDRERAPQDAARDAGRRRAPSARVAQEARRHAPTSSRRSTTRIKSAQQEPQEGRGGAKLDVERAPRRPYDDDPRRRAHGREARRPSWSRRTCASSSRSRRSTRTAACSSST